MTVTNPYPEESARVRSGLLIIEQYLNRQCLLFALNLKRSKESTARLRSKTRHHFLSGKLTDQRLWLSYYMLNKSAFPMTRSLREVIDKAIGQ